jgi:quercetin dioxygenase-like cupin family protein
MSTDNQDDVLTQDELLLLAEGSAPVSVDDSVKITMMRKIQRRINDACPAGGKTVRDSVMDWFKLNEHISIKVLHRDRQRNIQTALWRLQPGAVITGHQHDNDEECLVVEGSIQLGDYILYAGDYHRMESGSYHGDIHSKDGALLFLRHDLHEHFKARD